MTTLACIDVHTASTTEKGRDGSVADDDGAGDEAHHPALLGANIATILPTRTGNKQCVIAIVLELLLLRASH